MKRTSNLSAEARAVGLDPATVRGRLRIGWSYAEALSRPLGTGLKRKRDTSMTQRAIAAGFKPRTIHARMKREGLTLDGALKIPLRKTGEVLKKCRAAGVHRTTIYKRCMRYGMTFEQALAAPARCECCGEPGKIFADHNHKTEKFRGWLCQECNLGLGAFKDDPKRLRKAIAYLRKHSAC